MCVRASPCNHKRKHSEARGQGTHAAPAVSTVHVSVPLCLYTSGAAGERVVLGLTSHHHYLDCEGHDGEVLLWLKSQPKWTNLFIPYRPVQSQTKPSLRFVVSTTHSMRARARVCRSHTLKFEKPDVLGTAGGSSHIGS